MWADMVTSGGQQFTLNKFVFTRKHHYAQKSCDESINDVEQAPNPENEFESGKKW